MAHIYIYVAKIAFLATLGGKMLLSIIGGE